MTSRAKEFHTLARATISPGAGPNCKPIGTLTERSDVVAVFAALNSLPPAKRILVVVEARKDPPLFSRAFFPKIMPLEDV
jgi:hypothetical protein